MHSVAASAPLDFGVNHPDQPAEQQHLDQTVHAMLRQIDIWETRERNVGADLETSLTLADDAEEHAAVLAPHVHSPYFGSLNLTVAGKQQTVYIGQHAFMDRQGGNHIIAWESDVGGLFYAQETGWTTRNGLTGKVQRKRQLRVAAKRVTEVRDIYTDGQETGAREEVLIRRLSEAASSGMRDVIETLQPEQNEAVRAQPGQTLIIQGAAGSGKTTVGFHRLAWLASPERDDQRAAPEHSMMLMPNDVLAEYTKKILPRLNLESLQVTTPERWALSFLNIEKMTVTDKTLDLILSSRDKEERSHAWVRAKACGSNATFHLIRNYLHHRLEQNVERNADALKLHTDVNLAGRTVNVRTDHDTIVGLLRDVLKRDPQEGYRRAFAQELTDHLVSTHDLYSHQEELTRQLSSELQRLSGRIFTGLMPVGETRKLLSDHALIRQLGEGHLSESQLLALCSPPTPGPTVRAASIDVTEVPAVLTFHALLHGIGRRVGNELALYDHVVLDEAQDYAPLLYRMIARATRKGHITALGDMNQGLHSYKGPDTWNAVLEATEAARRSAPDQTTGQIMNLGRTYRSTKQITEVCANIASAYNRSGQAVVGVDRDGTPVQRREHTDLIQAVAEEVKNYQQLGHVNIALVCRKTTQAGDLPDALARHDVSAYAVTSNLH